MREEDDAAKVSEENLNTTATAPSVVVDSGSKAASVTSNERSASTGSTQVVTVEMETRSQGVTGQFAGRLP